jgi:hypothetical protein
MTKEQYVEYIKMEEVPIELYYEYYLEHKRSDKQLILLEDFEHLFNTFLINTQGKPIIINGNIKLIDLSLILNKIYMYFNKKFLLYE